MNLSSVVVFEVDVDRVCFDPTKCNAPVSAGADRIAALVAADERVTEFQTAGEKLVIASVAKQSIDTSEEWIASSQELLAMTANTASRSRGAICPSFAIHSRPLQLRAQGRPGARCTRGLVCNLCEDCAHEHTGEAESIRPSLRNGFTAYAVISPATNSSCHRRLRIKTCPSPVGPTRLHRLDTSNGCQDHTVLPYASAPFVCMPPIAHGLIKPALPSRVTPDAAASTASRPASVTIANRPSVGRDGDGYRGDLG